MASIVTYSVNNSYDMSRNSVNHANGRKVVNESDVKQIIDSTRECQLRLLNCNNPAEGANGTKICINAHSFCDDNLWNPYYNHERSPYDIRHSKDDPFSNTNVIIQNTSVIVSN
jgi:hypothetical protein